MKTRKILSLVLVVLMLVTAVFTHAVTSSASFDSEKIVVSSFSTMTHSWSKAEGWYNDISFWGEKVVANRVVNEDGSMTVSVTPGDYNYYSQWQTNWNGVAATTQTAYIDITNNSTKALRVRITTKGYTTPADADLPKVASGATKTIELGALTGGSISIMFQEQYGGSLACGTDLYTISPIYTEPFVEETTVTEAPTLPEGIEAVYSFASSNHNYSKTEGCNPNNNWAWGSFATTSMNYIADGSVSFDIEAGAYNKFRQFQTHWRNVPSETETTYIDITNNSTRTVRVRVSTSGYTTPADANLPQVKPKETITIELGALGGGGLSFMFLDLYGSDEILCGEDVFKLSPIYKMKPTTPSYNIYIDGELDTTVEEGTSYVFPEVQGDDFVCFFNEGTFYDSNDSIEVYGDMSFESLYLDLSMETGASFRLANPTGLRFYTTINKEQLSVLENYGATVQLGTLIAPADYLDSEELTFDLSKLFVDVKFNTRNWFKENEFSGFVGSITNIREGNINRGMVGRGYATITIGDITKTVYANYSDGNRTNNTRSICFIANKLLNSAEFELVPDAYKEIVEDYASKYVE